MNVRTRLAAMRSATRRALRERAWLLPAFGAVVGIVLAELVHNLEGPADPTKWAVSVDRARDTLLASLAIVFTGLSIVLALTATVAQNLASRFSIRLLRVQQRGLRDKAVVGIFSMTTAFIVVTQVELRSVPADWLAPQTGLMISAALMLVSGATIIWYISATMRSLRLDRAMHQVIRLIRRTVRNVEHGTRGESAAPSAALEPPPGAIPLPAHRQGYVAAINSKTLHRLAGDSGLRLGIEVLVGTPVAPGQRVGWMAATAGSKGEAEEVARAAVEIARSRDPELDAAYGVRILVDIALMALSPAVNDPYTAVEVVNELTFVLIGIAHHRPGPRGYKASADGFTVVRASRSLGDYVELAAEPILLYGAGDPQVTEALGRLAEKVEEVCETESDRLRARDFSRRVAAVALGTGEGVSPAGPRSADKG